MRTYSKGFSLLELLVVISIIGILVSISAVAFTTVQQKTRDSRRRSDMKALQSAFEQYKAEVGTYSASCSTMASYVTDSGAIMPGGLPADPRNTDSYFYNTGTGCAVDSYCLCTLLESGTGNASDPATNPTCTYAADGPYYCVSNLQ